MVFVCVCVNIPKTYRTIHRYLHESKTTIDLENPPFLDHVFNEKPGIFHIFLRVYPRVISAIEAKQPLVDDFFSGLSYC